MRQQALFLSALSAVVCAALLAGYCYISEYLGFHDFLFLNFSGQGKIHMSKGYQFLEAYSLIVSLLALCLSLSVLRRHPKFAVVGSLVAGALFVWAAILPRY